MERSWEVPAVVGESVDDAEGLPDLVVCVHKQIKFQLVGCCLLLSPDRELDAGLALCASCDDMVFSFKGLGSDALREG